MLHKTRLNVCLLCGIELDGGGFHPRYWLVARRKQFRQTMRDNDDYYDDIYGYTAPCLPI